MLWYLAAALIALIVLRKAQLRLILSRAKHRSLAGHARLGRFVTRLIPYYEYDETRFFCADDAPAEVAAPALPGDLRVAPRAEPVVANLEGETEQPAGSVESLRHGLRRAGQDRAGRHRRPKERAGSEAQPR